MPHPAVVLVTIGIALGAAMAVFAFLTTSQKHTRSSSHRPNRSLDFEYIDTSIICTICIDKINSDLIYLECGHSFHGNCIQKWFKDNNTCPNCKNVQTNKI
ncbi:unnamed protein product [Hermetia illucens]|uniref:RING-type E3 ubiquitin transferase n=1 Tax=Hermetia illucens TaxID=343691 RepID=A0A7R8Z4U0_HERIL|nr:E3 ubiquitin-protein ligase Iruka [Hermetia illucens]XP_037923987.1 E3 ubiquitin-protein ligase Iruka [Hermetia illucens]XP_037923988.1 E3 ubiquitin-protein ligase Iruka [Hermetia illucens]XP_037923989.1 E3 ubiquitin-protein ligase Iruka [Hermetia illucens]CAD7093347.1 unnamed protein product [Hermetia illucens]